MNSSGDGAQCRLVRLPTELLEVVISYLTNGDIKALRLTCKSVRDVVHLRLTRIFLSPNPRNVQVFKAIARHQTYRQRVTEIIYDDARLPESLETDQDTEYAFLYDPPRAGVPNWYARAYNELVERLENWRSFEVQRPDHIARAARLEARLNVKKTYREYQKLLRHQNKAISANADAEALRYGLSRFPRLRRITLTSATHGRDLRPLYETPMIRELPYGFIYPTPYGWPTMTDSNDMPVAEPWEDEDEKNKWRGFRVITSVLASYLEQSSKPPKAIPEFIIDTNHLVSGISCRVFDEPNHEYNDLVTILQQPGFSRIDLSLVVGGQEWEGWHSFRSTSLRSALAQARGLQHVSLFTNVYPAALCLDRPEAEALEQWVPLQTIFPVDTWSNLQHFGLSRFIVKQSDLLGLLAVLPPTLRSVELSFLFFLTVEGSYREFIVDVRDQLGWRERPLSERPRITIATDPGGGEGDGIAIYVDRETEDFVYGNGENPFGNVGQLRNRVFSGVGIERDAFEPAHERPNIDPVKLMHMGIIKMSDWAKGLG
ncbi:hypothetical protein ACHAQA_002473 [Verticillium albo-atrum]